jgi:hypothetical protein
MAPASCALMNPSVAVAAMPVNVSVNDRAIVTAG